MKKNFFFLILLILINSCNKTVDTEQKHHDEQKNVITTENEALQKAKIFLRKLHLELDSNYSLENISGNIEDIPEYLIETEKFQLYLNSKNFKIRNFVLNDFKVGNNTKDFEDSKLQKISEELLNNLKISDEVENFKDYKLDNLYIQNGICYSIYTKGESLLILGFNPINNEIVLLTIR
jgi:hypothetical protein